MDDLYKQKLEKVLQGLDKAKSVVNEVLVSLDEFAMVSLGADYPLLWEASTLDDVLWALDEVKESLVTNNEKEVIL